MKTKRESVYNKCKYTLNHLLMQPSGFEDTVLFHFCQYFRVDYQNSTDSVNLWLDEALSQLC